MRKTRGEGRTAAEKSQRLLLTPDERERLRQELKRQEREWSARSGPVTVRKTNEGRA